MIDRARWSGFVTELKEVAEKIELKYGEKEIDNHVENNKTPIILFTEKYDETNIPATLKNEVESLGGQINNLYYANGLDGIKNNVYLYEPTIKVVFKIEGINIWNTTIHSVDKGNKIKPGDTTEKEEENPTPAEMTPEYTYGYYEPNLDGFDINNTYVIYYSSDYSSKKEVVLKQYLKDGRKQRIQENGVTYTFHDYKNTTDAENTSTWGNVKTIANGLEAWWVWIPRYAYNAGNISKTNGFEIKFTTIENKVIQIDQEGTVELKDISEYSNYVAHSGFTEKYLSGGAYTNVKELTGIWVTKYEPSFANNVKLTERDICYAPNVEGYDVNNTYIVTYNKPYTNAENVYVDYGQEIKNQYQLKDVLTSDSVVENGSLKKGEVDLTKIPNDEIWYDYGKQIWGNVKTVANGLEAWWVWIPRYAYYNGGSITGFDIAFVDVDDKPFSMNTEGLYLYQIQPGFNLKESDGTTTKLKGIWVSKYEPSYIKDTFVGSSGNNVVATPTNVQTDDGSTYTFTKSPTDGHTHVPNGAGTKTVHVTNRTDWCTAYNGTTPCSNNGHYIYCSLCGIRLRHYWCDAHYGPSTKVIINDDDME